MKISQLEIFLLIVNSWDALSKMQKTIANWGVIKLSKSEI